MSEAIVDVSVSYSDDSGNGKEFVYGKCIGEIVRCKDCKEWAKTIGDEGFSLGRCEFLGRDLVMSIGFCAWGVRKDDEDK